MHDKSTIHYRFARVLQLLCFSFLGVDIWKRNVGCLKNLGPGLSFQMFLDGDSDEKEDDGLMRFDFSQTRILQSVWLSI